MVTSFTDWNPNELYHFGVRGMKWGQRRYQNDDGSLTALGRERYGTGQEQGHRTARGMKHDLNKLDREQSNARARYDQYNNASIKKSARLSNKLKSALADNDKKAVKSIRREQKKVDEKYTKKAEQYKRLLNKSKSMTNRILDSAKAKGYSVHSRECLRDVNRGRNFAKSMLLSGATQVVLGANVGVYSKVQGTHYGVKNDGLGTRTHRSKRYRAI